jgi:hypothetical protein
MNVHLAQELLNELGSSLENLEAQQSALLQFLKEKGVVTDDQLAPYLNQAGNASNVRWRAARVRLERIFSAETEKEPPAAPEQKQAGAQTPPPQAMEGAKDRDRDKDKDKDDKDKERSESKTDSKPAATEGAPAKKEKASAETKSALPASNEETNGEERKPSTTKRDEEAA